MQAITIRTGAIVAALALMCGAFWAPSVLSTDDGKSVNIYSARKEALILPILERFRDQTGIEFNLVTGKADALLKRLRMEGEASPADVFITVDAGRLHRAKEAGVLPEDREREHRRRRSAASARCRWLLGGALQAGAHHHLCPGQSRRGGALNL